MKNILVLKLPRFFPYRVSERKSAANSKLACLSQKRDCSCIDLALVYYFFRSGLSSLFFRGYKSNGEIFKQFSSNVFSNPKKL